MEDRPADALIVSRHEVDADGRCDADTRGPLVRSGLGDVPVSTLT
jgi:hypothetical protein